MRYLFNALLALLMGCFMPVIFWVSGGVALYQVVTYQKRKGKKVAEIVSPELICSIDADCPYGYVCLNGRCVSEN